MKHTASCSFGKDSLTMVLKLIENKSPLDEVVFYDTGKEFEAIYQLRDKMQNIFDLNDIKYTELHPKNTFDYNMFERPVKTTKYSPNGYGWCGGVCRWGTTEKTTTIDKEKCDVRYVGIAIDEPKRLNKERKSEIKFPLAEWEMTESDCLAYCYANDIHWLEKTDSIYEVPEYIDLYSVLDRVSCWCCRNKNLKELKSIYYYFTNSYWKQLKDIQSRLPSPMKPSGSVFELEERFKGEIERDGGLLVVKSPKKLR